jgi:hypothetical protein
MASREQPSQGMTGLGGGRHHWPVTLRHGPVILAPLRHRDRAAWERVRRENASWLRPWEATLPPGSQIGPSTYAGLVRSVSRQAREGRMLPWLVYYEEESNRSKRLRILGPDWLLDRPATRRTRDHPDGCCASCGLLLQGHITTPNRDRDQA